MLTAYDGTAITYDAIGNPLSDGTRTYTWEHGREMASVSVGSETWTNTYNADGLRTKRTNGATAYDYVYYGGQLMYMMAKVPNAQTGKSTNYHLIFSYTPEGAPMGMTYQGTAYYYLTNLQGDVVAILNNQGQRIVSYTYDAWGNPLSTVVHVSADDANYAKYSTIAELNPLRYRGYVYDAETGLYYLNSRYYNSEIGRFINGDGLIVTGQEFAGNNMFAYCGGNPITYNDFSGKERNYCVNLTDTGGKRNPLIYRQDASPCTELTYGKYPASKNSCGVIAAYNALVLKGYKGQENSFPSILEDFEDLGYPLANGKLGTWPTSIGVYMTRRGVECSRWVGFGDLDKIIKPGEVLIVSVWNNGSIKNGMHTFTCLRTESGWETYNRYYANRAICYQSFNDILEVDRLAYVLMIY